jgi:hypothetical protein
MVDAISKRALLLDRQEMLHTRVNGLQGSFENSEFLPILLQPSDHGEMLPCVPGIMIPLVPAKPAIEETDDATAPG